MEEKLMGASSSNLIFLLSREFRMMLLITAIIALPVTYILFEKFVLSNFPYHTPMQFAELFVGLLMVVVIAFFLIGSLTMKAARNNPAEVLKCE